MKREYLLCDGQCHLLQLSYDEEWGLEMSMWKRSHSGGKLSWRERIRWCWHLITTGELWVDEIILDKEKIHQFVKFMKQLDKDIQK